ncbi:MAG: hypothetical protein IJA33_05590 [Oscillospiraceae bacterium]|nr:hypothetical protein [Oscillospiraceae bacterium]
MKQLLKTLPQKLKKLLQFLLNPRFLLCFGLGWMITNGWSYALLGLGTFYDIGWMKAVAGAYLAILWFPFSPEKIITVAIAIGLLQWLFPKDTYTLGVLRNMRTKAIEAARRSREERRARREANRIRFRKEGQIPQQPSGEERDT